MISTPTMFQVPFSPGSVNSTRQKPSLQTRPKSRRAIRPECLARRSLCGGGCAGPNHRGHLPCRLQEPAGRSSRSRARHSAGWRWLARSGVAALRGLASPGSLRAHPSRHPARRDVMPVALRSVHKQCRCGHISLSKPNSRRGLRSEKCCFCGTRNLCDAYSEGMLMNLYVNILWWNPLSLSAGNAGAILTLNGLFVVP